MIPFRPNQLELQAWGKLPPSRRRRRIALRAYLGRSLLLIGALILIAAICIVASLRTIRRIPNDVWEIVLASCMFVSAVFSALAPFRLENKFSNARAFQANLDDYRMAGFRPGDILFGLAAPQLAGARLFANVTAIAGFITVGTIPVWAPHCDGTAFALILMVFIAPIFNVIMGTKFALAQWRHPSRGFRTLRTACLIFSSPLTVCTCFPPLFLLFHSEVLLIFLLCIEAVAMGIRGQWAASEWSRAVKWIEGRE